MSEMIQKPDTNPAIIGVANLFFFGGLGYYLMGQEKKALIGVIASVALSVFSCGTLIWLPAFIFAYDGFLLGQKLQSGQAIGKNENGLPFLDNIFKD